MRIAYQGIPGCNSEAASELFATNQGFVDPEYIPAVHSAGVIELLKSGQADYGVMASRNLIAGEVLETREALTQLQYRTIDAQWLSVHHCLFKKNKDSEIKKIASHVQAIGQCRKKLKKKYPDAVLMDAEDTAIAARYLAEGRYSDDTAVL